MAESLGTLDFFLLEGGEYLERLDALAQTPAGTFTPVEEFVRLSRALRGGAIMASQHGMARAAQGLESASRAVREGRLRWDEAARAEVIRAIDDCKILMRRLRSPEQGDTEKAEQIGIRLDRLSGRASGVLRATQGPGLDAGARAFVAREAAAIGSALQNAARTLTTTPAARDALSGLIPAMSALRGVAVLNDLPPLSDILAAIESTVKEGGASIPVPREVPAVLDAAAKALARAAREVVDHGRPDGESDEARDLASRLFGLLAATGGVPVESLFYGDAGPHVVQTGTTPDRAGPGRVELVSQGEFLTAAASELARAATGVQRDLRLFGIAANLRPMVGAGGGTLGDALGRFADAARGAVAGGIASLALEGFVGCVQDAAQALAGAQASDEGALAQRVDNAAATIAALAPAAAPPPPVAAPVAPVAPPHTSIPVAALLGEADLVASYFTLEQLITERGLPLTSLDELLSSPTPMPGGAAAAAPALPRATPAPLPAAPAPRVTAARGLQSPTMVPAAAPPDDAGVVPVEALLYRGDAALRRIKELQPSLAAAARTGDAGLDALLREVFDLVELGLGR